MSSITGPVNRESLFTEVVEGFYLETCDRLFFAVKGLVHPPDRTIAVLRYVPDEESGNRRRGDKSYRRLYHFDEQELFLRSTCSQYLAYDPVYHSTLQSVPKSKVLKIYDPRRKYAELADARNPAAIEQDAYAFLNLLQTEAQVAHSALGITGSLLTGLYTKESDLDAVVFGESNCKKVYAALKTMLGAPRGEALHRLDASSMDELFGQRSADTRMDYREFLALEKRKVNQGLFRKRAYFIRFVKEAHEAGEVYGHLRYTPWGRATITASIADDQESIFTPCRYGLSGVQILDGQQVEALTEIVSFRGRFCEQSRRGEKVRASGTMERVEVGKGDFRYRLLLGNVPEDGMSVLPA